MIKFAGKFKPFKSLSTAGYIFALALAAKLIFLYGSQHPAKYELLPVNGLVQEVRLGGNGKSTAFRIESDHGTHRYSSYFGKVWPGMERIEFGDRVQILAERKKLNRNEIISGKEYYIWEIIHHGEIILTYDSLNIVQACALIDVLEIIILEEIDAVEENYAGDDIFRLRKMLSQVAKVVA
jgi:hypothetical protein